MKNSKCSGCSSYYVVPSAVKADHWSCLDCGKFTPYSFDATQGLPCRCGKFSKTDLGTTEKCQGCGYEGLKNWKEDLLLRPRHRLSDLFAKYGKGVKVSFHNRPETWYFEITHEDCNHPGLFYGREVEGQVELNDYAGWGSEADDIGWFVVGEK